MWIAGAPDPPDITEIFLTSLFLLRRGRVTAKCLSRSTGQGPSHPIHHSATDLMHNPETRTSICLSSQSVGTLDLSSPGQISIHSLIARRYACMCIGICMYAGHHHAVLHRLRPLPLNLLATLPFRLPWPINDECWCGRQPNKARMARY